MGNQKSSPLSCWYSVYPLLDCVHGARSHTFNGETVAVLIACRGATNLEATDRAKELLCLLSQIVACGSRLFHYVGSVRCLNTDIKTAARLLFAPLRVEEDCRHICRVPLAVSAVSSFVPV
jgi:hypothetical protein